MSTEAKVGIGVSMRRKNGSLWQVLAEVTAISIGGTSREVIETFKLNNTDDYVNKLQGVLNAGSISVSMNYTKAQWLVLKSDLETRGTRNYQIRLPDGEALDFYGFITEMPLDLGSDDVMQGDITFEIDGKPDFLTAWT
jgi:hypothetical protein